MDQARLHPAEAMCPVKVCQQEVRVMDQARLHPAEAMCPVKVCQQEVRVQHTN